MHPRAVFFLCHSLKSHFDGGDTVSLKTYLCTFHLEDITQTDAIYSSFYLFFLNQCCAMPWICSKCSTCFLLVEQCLCWCAALQPAGSHRQVPVTCALHPAVTPLCFCSFPSSRPHTINPPNPLARGPTYSRVC